MSESDDPQAPSDGQRVSGRFTADPLLALPNGSTIKFGHQPFPINASTRVPQSVNNWDFFQGTVLSVMLGDRVLGSAVAIAPGLAVSAWHVLSDEIGRLAAGEVAVFCNGLTPHGLDIWRVAQVDWHNESDIVFLSLELACDRPLDNGFVLMPLSTRDVRVGDDVTLLGFRCEEPLQLAKDGTYQVYGHMYAASGAVSAVFSQRRDRRMPFPSFEIECGALGGMSGGAVLDSTGHLVGVVCSSFETGDGDGPSYASWIIGALSRPVSILWPPGVHKNQPSRLIDVDPLLMAIAGREHVVVQEDKSSQGAVRARSRATTFKTVNAPDEPVFASSSQRTGAATVPVGIARGEYAGHSTSVVSFVIEQNPGILPARRPLANSVVNR